MALDAYLDDYGWRLGAGHDLLEPTVGERPELVVATVNACRRQRAVRAAADGTSAIRASIPERDRDRFDVLLADARASYALRDDDVGVCWNWPLGLVRRAGLEIARRLVDRDLLADPRHLFEADTDEALALLPTGDRQGRTRRGRARSALGRAGRAASATPPAHLDGGGEPAAAETLPANVARLTEIRDALWGAAPTRVDAPLHGVGIGSQQAVGHGTDRASSRRLDPPRRG